MMLTKYELHLLFLSLNQDKSGEPRKFQFIELPKVSRLAKKMEHFIVDGKIADQEEFELELDAEERVFCKEKIEERQWMLGDANSIISLVEKLK